MPQKYKNNFLTAVVCRVDFIPIPIELFDEKCAILIPLINQTLSIYNKRNFIEWQTKIVSDTKVDESTKTSLHEFFDSTKQYKFVLAYNYLSLESFKYVDFESFEQLILKIFKIIFDAFTEINIQRLGLRYINQIKIREGDPLDWGNFIKPSLVANVDSFIDDKTKLSRTISQMTINDEDYQVSFTFGFYNSEFPNRIARKEFLLDFDCFIGGIETNSMFSRVKQFNTRITDLFEKSIEDGLRDKMERNTGG